jgi:hypothetical protein
MDAVGSAWRFLGASVVGACHPDGQCQDAHKAIVLDNGLLLLAVADGVGSESRSSEGAQAALRGLQTYWQAFDSSKAISQEDLSMAAYAAWAEVEKTAIAAELSPDRFASTLIFSIIANGKIAVFQVGDGTCIIRSKGSYALAITPEVHEFSNVTHVLSAYANAHHAQYFFSPDDADIDAIALLTDGLDAHSYDFDAQAPFAPFFDQPFSVLAHAQAGYALALQASIEAYLQSPNVAKLCADDKSLVLAVNGVVATKPEQ